MPASFTLLGTSAGPGVPSYFCDCCGCREARENPALARTRSGALVRSGDGFHLIDTPPDLRQQLVNQPLQSILAIEQIFLTHWHYDHFGGLGELEYYVKLHRKQPIKLFLPPSAVASFHDAFPDLTDVFDVSAWVFGQSYPLGDCSVTPLPAAHGIETAGFLITAPDKRLAYFPDTAGLPEFTRQRLGSLDWFFCDATFTGDNWFPNSHMSIDEAVSLGRDIGAASTVLTHLSIHYSHSMTVRDLQDYLADSPDVFIAYDGMEIVL
ncbi:MAG: MBL fold metallo-hydrolase [Desulfuromonas sp.]|nr:MAG: MBL fold metallo-hydrolase [Desulfuromonas sp.]